MAPGTRSKPGEPVARPAATGLRPLVLLATWSTDVDLVAPLEARLGGRAVRVVEAPAGADADGLRSVDDWVVHHLERLEALEVEPPYLLAGFSFGGVVALEMARRLAPGGAVDYVGMIDTVRPRLRPKRLRDAVPYHLAEAALLPDRDERRRYLRKELRLRVVRRAPEPLLRARRTLLRRPHPAAGRTFERPTEPLVRAIHRSYLKYVARPTEIPVHLFPTQQSVARCSGDVSLRWAAFLRGGFTVTPIAGTHSTIGSSKHVDVLAAAMRAQLDLVDPPR